MVRLPARLTSKLAKGRVARIFGYASLGSLLHCVDPVEVLHPGSAAPVSCEKMRALVKNPAPVIWIGGSEPLLHAGVGHFLRAIAQSGHCVFLETDGTSLGRRIHEFQPLPEIFLTVRLNSLQAADAALAVEGLRAARLSGFFTAIHTPVRGDSDLGELAALGAFVKEKDFDGWMVTAAAADQAVVRKAAEARTLVRSSFWRQFSKHVEEALLSQALDREMSDAQDLVSGSLDTEAGEEGVRIA